MKHLSKIRNNASERKVNLKPRMAEYKIAGRLQRKEISRPKQEEERTQKNAT